MFCEWFSVKEEKANTPKAFFLGITAKRQLILILRDKKMAWMCFIRRFFCFDLQMGTYFVAVFSLVSWNHFFFNSKNLKTNLRTL